MKRPLKDNEIPPGSWIWKGPVYAKLLIITIHTIGVEVLCNNHVTYISWKDLKQYRITQDPRKPWEDWQPCWVDEFNVSDYKPGQEVDYHTARNLYKKAVALDYSDDKKQWEPVITALEASDKELAGWGARFRVAIPAPKMRDLRPDELPPKIIVSWPNICEAIWHNPSKRDIRRAVEGGAKWSTNLDGPWHEFWKEE